MSYAYSRKEKMLTPFSFISSSFASSGVIESYGIELMRCDELSKYGIIPWNMAKTYSYFFIALPSSSSPSATSRILVVTVS